MSNIYYLKASEDLFDSEVLEILKLLIKNNGVPLEDFEYEKLSPELKEKLREDVQW